MRDLPTGTVTFLFTDVEGSTRLLERLGGRYRDIQIGHDSILRAAVAEGDGREVSTEGDSFFAVFSAPVGAISAATEAQRQLAETPWPDGAVVRVRMGLHTGEGILGGDNYLGLDVNRAARITAAAHGGQVLLSDATRALVERSLPSGTRLRDLGHHRLKDLMQPERLHQVVIEGLEQDFPPPRSLDARPHNLPAQLTRFIGRDDHIARVGEVLAGDRLVTLTGPGGSGKTRLGLQVAAEALAGFRDGVFFVDLSAVTDPELVPDEIAAALHVRAEPARAILDTLGDHLRDKELLLVLDNFEQVVGTSQSVLEPLLQVAPRVKALVTSRVPLHVYGEREYPVPPLVLLDPDHVPKLDALVQNEAVSLFIERALAVKPSFQITNDNAPAVAHITARLDGLPLAIELAASRVKLLTPQGILERLVKRLPLLRAQDRNVPERQRTLRQTIEWSYDLLNEAERRMFTRLSVFAGGADLEAVEAVANMEGELGLDSLDGLASLVDKNLVRSVNTSEDESRFAMLETIREYGLERLSESGEESVIRRRHAEHWIVVGERASEPLLGAEQAAATRRIELDHDNFRSALAWVLKSGEAELGLRLGGALREFWRLGGHLSEGVRWLNQLLALPGAAGRTFLRARALTAAADLTSWTGQREENLRFAEEAVSIYRDLGDPDGIPDALEELGAAQMFAGQLEAARAALEEARELNIDRRNRQKAGECTFALGMLALLEGRPGQARERFEDALATFNDLRDPYWTAFVGRLIGHVDRMEGKNEDAESRFRASLSSSRQHDLLYVIASGLYAFADLALTRGQHERAIRLAGASDALRERLGEVRSFEKELVGDVREAASSFMDEATAESLYKEGRRMEADDAVAYALQQAGA
ncbi:MAG TPA: adenylate/guanylate cyclase domain-containing protein [Actinomycetota bacterium]|nr:adenylate/guanylate cyclase domain-containing protein [Actinomycetota bacterium]